MPVTEDERAALLRAHADGYARVGLANIRREFPHHEALLLADERPPPRPRELHPAFYGSFDWHSCVEMHWMLLRLLRLAPELVPADEIRAALDRHLTAEHLAAETQFFADAAQRGNERPYGWGWALALAHEAASWPADPHAARWAGHLRGLAGLFTERFVEWLGRMAYPVRHGVHSNTAFALRRALPHAELTAATGGDRLRAAIRDAADRWFRGDRDYPAGWEPSGTDFLSPALAEAELMAALLPAGEFASWLDGFLPGLADGAPAALFTPALVTDPTDGQGAHLHGLNLSRACAARRIAEALPADDPRRGALAGLVRSHADAALPHAVGTDYMVEHWLACYAVLLLT